MTLCTANRTRIFGSLVQGQVQLTPAGRVAAQCWRAIPRYHPYVGLDAFVIMPDHVHGILWIVEQGTARNGTSSPRGVGFRGGVADPPTEGPGRETPRSPARELGSIVRGFKIGVTQWVRAHTSIRLVWQRNYHEHVIRDDRDLRRIRQYIETNPSR